MIYTSYFAKLSKLPANITPIAICGKSPEWYKGIQYKKLAPKWSFFSVWKQTHDNDYYVEHFCKEVLYALNADDVIKLSVSSSSVPHFTQTTISVKRGNNEMKFAGTPSFGDGTIKLNDWIGAGTKDVLLAWQRLSYNVKTEKVGLAADYKRDAYLLEYTPDDQLVTTWVLKGCWISGLSEDGFDHESNEKNVITATITYDKAYIDDDWADEE